jgi:hypothetical protein
VFPGLSLFQQINPGMKKYSLVITILTLLVATSLHAQEIQTLFRGGHKSVNAYGAISNKFTFIRGEYANMAEIYGGVFINHRLLLGISGAAVTNDIKVPQKFLTEPGRDLSYEYAQFGLITEYVFFSNRVVHFNVGLFSGAGMTVQYERNHDDWDEENPDFDNDENFFYVFEPNIQAEVNVFRWMRFSPGISWRKSFGSDGLGMSDGDITDMSYNVTLKFGKF